MSLMVFSMTHLKRSSSATYLSALSLADTGFLLSLFIVWLPRVQVPIFHTAGWCQMTIYLTHIFCFLSVWMIVSFSAERYIIVYHPLSRDTYCTKTKARIVIGCLFVFALVLYCSTLVTSGVVRFHTQQFCMPLPQYYEIITVMTSVDTFLAWVVPSLIIVILNIKLIIRLKQYQKKYTTRACVATASQSRPRTGKVLRRSRVLQTSISTTGSMHFRFAMSPYEQDNNDHPEVDYHAVGIIYPDLFQKHLKHKSQFRTAKMLLVLSSVFVLLNLPSHIFRIYTFVESLTLHHSKSTKVKVRWQELFHLVYFLNFAINFFVYSLCNRNFRHGISRLYRRFLHRCKYCGILSKMKEFCSPQERYDGCEVVLNNEGYRLKRVNSNAECT